MHIFIILPFSAVGIFLFLDNFFHLPEAFARIPDSFISFSICSGLSTPPFIVCSVFRSYIKKRAIELYKKALIYLFSDQ